MAAMAAEKVEMTILALEAEALAGLERLLRESGPEPGAVAGWLGAARLIERACLFDRRGRLLYPEALSTDEGPVMAALLAELSPGFWDRGGRRHIRAGDHVILAAALPRGEAAPVLAVLTLDEEYLRREVLARALGGLEGPSVPVVLDARERPVYSAQPVDRAQRVLTVAFGEALPEWRLALYQPEGTSVRDAVRRQAMLFTSLFALLLVVIVLGLCATYRVVQRESEMARLKSDFVANVSHDLKTPLALIRMFGETLELGRVRDAATRQEYYGVITRESERLTRLINNVLDFSRIEGGRQRYDVRPGTLEPVIHEALEAFRYPLAQDGFKVELAVEPGLPRVAIDPDAIGQAVANLIDNAIKYSGDGRRIRVEARRAGDEVRLSVEDDGLGIPAEELPRIFDKFYRAGQSDTQGRRGSGLGLTLVRHVMEAHGGRVTVESAPRRGSRFTLHLRAAA
jgi:signal transduction histidine kinase